MQFRIVAIQPEPETVPAHNGLLAKKLEIGSEQVAFVQIENDIRVYASDGADAVSIKLPKGASALLCNRNCQIYIDVTELNFSNTTDDDGVVQLWSNLRLLSDLNHPHPLATHINGKLTSESFVHAIQQSLTLALSRPLSKWLGQFQYAASKDGGAQESLGQHLAGFPDVNVRQTMALQAGMAFIDASPLWVVGVSAYRLDKEAAHEQSRKLREQARRRELQEYLANASVKRARDQVDHEDAIQSQKRDLECEQVRLRKMLAREQVRLALMLEERKATEEGRAAKAEADRLEEAVRLEQTRIRLTEAEIEQKAQEARRHKTEADAIEAKLAILERAQSQMAAAPAASGKNGLSMLAEWRAYNKTGVVKPRLGLTETLPSGLMLELTVLVSRDAYVYVLLKDSAGAWVSLVPNVEGVSQSNFQEAGEPVSWPGENPYCPELPYWQLDTNTGFERFVVITSIEPFDPLNELGNNEAKALECWSRGVCFPVYEELARGSGSTERLIDYTRAIRVLSGEGRVCQELVVEHI